MTINRKSLCGLACAGSLFVATQAQAGAHTWRVNEVLSNVDGTIQFIELRECCGGAGEVFLQGLQVKSDSTGSAFTFPSNLAGPTSNRSILLATAGFASLPGAPTPDHIIPAGFFNRNGDTVRYHVYHALTFGPLPTNCVDSFNLNIGVALNSPANYAGQSAAVNCNPPPPPCAGDINGDNNVNVNDLLAVINAWGPCPVKGPCPADISPPGGNGTVNVNDLLSVINAWGPCP